jgi:hypothetical protein
MSAGDLVLLPLFWCPLLNYNSHDISFVACPTYYVVGSAVVSSLYWPHVLRKQRSQGTGRQTVSTHVTLGYLSTPHNHTDIVEHRTELFQLRSRTTYPEKMCSTFVFETSITSRRMMTRYFYQLRSGLLVPPSSN